MARNRREQDKSVSTPAQEDEADILAEVGAVAAEDGSGLVTDEAKVVEAGAVDTESIRENRRIDAIVGKQRGNVEGTRLNVENICDKYDIVLRSWPANILTINVTRRSGGAPVTWRIDSKPKNGSELYAAIRALHGPNEEATYDVSFTDAGKFRGQGVITMPNARPPTPPGQQPMQPPYTYGPPGYPQVAPPAPQQPPVVQVVPPTTDPVAMMQQMFQMFQQMQASMQQPHQAQPQPTPVPSPTLAQPATPPTDPMAMMQQMFHLFQQMQSSVQQQPQAQPQAMQPPPQPAVPGQQPTDPMSMMQQMFQLFQQMQQGVAPTAAARAARVMPQPQPVPQPAAPPATDPVAMMQQMFQMFQQMQMATIQAMGGATPGAVGRPPYRGPYTGPRPGYAGQDPAVAGYPGPHQPPPPPKSAAQEFRDSISFVRTIVDAAQEIQSILPGQAGAQPEAREPEEDTTPVKVMDVGDYKLVLDKKDGHARLWETGWANMGPVLKWVGEQREAIQKSNAEKQAKQQQQLPPGYVEVGPGYVPPPGYVAVQVDPSQVPQMQPPLPPPPAQMPPPISEPPQRRWGAPTLPGEEN